MALKIFLKSRYWCKQYVICSKNYLSHYVTTSNKVYDLLEHDILKAIHLMFHGCKKTIKFKKNKLNKNEKKLIKLNKKNQNQK